MHKPATETRPPMSLSFFGYILPGLVLVLEFFTGICAELFFDPIPHVGHILLIAGCVMINAWTIQILHRQKTQHLNLLRRLNGVAIGVSFYFMFLFLPLYPFACIALAIFGLGFIPLAPLGAFVATIRISKRLALLSEAQGQTSDFKIWRPVLAGLAVIALLSAPWILSYTGLTMVSSEQVATQNQGIKLLRTFGSEKVLLRNCYHRNQFMNLYHVRGPGLSIAACRETYYRVTGTPYNAVRRPNQGGRFGTGNEWDFHQGGDMVAARVGGLSLIQSRMDSVIDAKASTVYTEWILEFKNDSGVQREARTQIALPPGGVASRLTLWIEGEEREAAYSGKSKVKAAYKKVVRRRRDPVLATTTGAGRVLLQCFPVPPNGGTMKTKIGITSPLQIESREQGLMCLPYLSQENFRIAPNCANTVWIESATPLAPMSSAPNIIVEKPAEGGYTLRGEMDLKNLFRPFAVQVDRDPQWTTIWSANKHGSEDTAIIRSTIQPKTIKAPEHLVIVIDGSRHMRPYQEALLKAMELIPMHTECSILLASDQVKTLMPLGLMTEQTLQAATQKIKRIRFRGGCDNVPALHGAWNLLSAKSNSAILWLHAAQPVEFSGTESLLQKWERRPDGPQLYDLQLGRGANRILEKLKGRSTVRQVLNFGDPRSDLHRLLNGWNGSITSFGFDYVAEPDGEHPAEQKVSDHVVRLWAAEKVDHLTATGHENDRYNATQLSILHRLITPVAGAVVLENEQQYKEADLSPADKSSVPTIAPEPDTLVIMIWGLFLMRWVGNRRNRPLHKGT